MIHIENTEKGFDKETAFRTLELINSWINNADTKVSYALTFATVMLGLIFYNAGEKPKAVIQFYKAYTDKNLNCCHWLSVIVLISLYIAFFLVCIFFVFSLKGTVKNSNQNRSMFFFGTIASCSLNEYKSKLFSMTEDAMEKDLAEQIHQNSQICMAKFKWYNRGLTALCVASVLCVISLIFEIL